MDDLKRKEELDQIRAEVISCEKCPLSKTRTNAVPGEGNFSAQIMFIGEAPGANEDINGIPFCGAAGKFLDEMLDSVGLSRDLVFITNTCKCRPPENRDPEDDEKATCRPYLERQIELINPKVIVCLGRHAALSLIPGAASISKIHGHALRRPNGRIYLPLYHPAAALHNGGLRQTLISDFSKIQAIIKKIDEAKIEQKEEIKQQKLI